MSGVWMDWKSQNGRICAETGQREPPEFEIVFLPSSAITTTRAKNGLLIAQGHHGIDFAGATCGNIAGGERDQGKQDGDADEG
jgi:hypothetical protein